MTHYLWNANNNEFLRRAIEAGTRWDMVFADPPDNIGLGYDECEDSCSDHDYKMQTYKWIANCLKVSDTLWWSFNARHTCMMGAVLFPMDVVCKPCVQTFTFGQHNSKDFGNNHRPLWRITNGKARVFPEQIKVPSWRQLNGDKRAAEGGRVPGDVFDFTRVTGNSKQRRPWHPTQLNEDLVERCIMSSTVEGEQVLDIFGGTGTTLRVCNKINRRCTLVEMSANYCTLISNEHSIKVDRL